MDRYLCLENLERRWGSVTWSSWRRTSEGRKEAIGGDVVEKEWRWREGELRCREEEADYKSMSKHKAMFPTSTNHNMQQRTLIIPKISNLIPLAIPKCRLQFAHTTLNSAINRHSRRQITRSEGSDTTIIKRKPRILCLHGFRTSGEIFRTQMKKWPELVLEKLELFFPDAPFPCNGRSGVEGIFDPPYYEWFQSSKDFQEYENFDECLEYIEECMIKLAPIDGLLGFSQGAILSAALPGLQAKGLALTRVPKIGFVVIISGAKLKNKALAEKAYSLPIQCPSLHFLGDKDFLKPYGIELLKSVENPVVIHHPKAHTIPRLDEESLETMLKFIDRIHDK
ncbi:hypothetical protein SSX86_011913 [Deinandra increscens subsp. villosa]|uniref:Serine hydrolase domain-containing protein n=1 Tax=Deinandra increscens subsp. villosa TaxID=3103831 RepID=A0AAP0D8E1_9ASTR